MVKKQKKNTSEYLEFYILYNSISKILFALNFILNCTISLKFIINLLKCDNKKLYNINYINYLTKNDISICNTVFTFIVKVVMDANDGYISVQS